MTGSCRWKTRSTTGSQLIDGHDVRRGFVDLRGPGDAQNPDANLGVAGASATVGDGADDGAAAPGGGIAGSVPPDGASVSTGGYAAAGAGAAVAAPLAAAVDVSAANDGGGDASAASRGEAAMGERSDPLPCLAEDDE